MYPPLIPNQSKLLWVMGLFLSFAFAADLGVTVNRLSEIRSQLEFVPYTPEQRILVSNKLQDLFSVFRSFNLKKLDLCQSTRENGLLRA
jgi:hypothetical protein